MLTYKIAGVVFNGQFIYGYTERLCKNYVYSGSESPCFTITTTQKDIDAEKDKEGAEGFPDYYLESLAVYRKLCNELLKDKQAVVFHCSAIAVNGKAYLFTAPSGTGKSTHARLWREMLGDKAVMINDDKPVIRYEDDKFYVYGTPWNGKHRLDTNDRAEIAAICELKRGEKNVIEEISAKDMIFVALNQTIRPPEPELMENLLSLIDKLLRSVKLYRLHCNISKEAAEVSYNAMVNNK